MKIDKTIQFRDAQSFNDIEVVIRKTKTYKKKFVGDLTYKKYTPPTITEDEFKELLKLKDGDRFESYLDPSSLNNVIRGIVGGVFFYTQYEDNLPRSQALGVKSCLEYNGAYR